MSNETNSLGGWHEPWQCMKGAPSRRPNMQARVIDYSSGHGKGFAVPSGMGTMGEGRGHDRSSNCFIGTFFSQT